MPQTVNGYTVPAGSDAVSTIDDTMATFAGQLPAQGFTTGAALKFIATQTFSAAGSVSVNSCFTSTYDTYRVVIDATSNQGSATWAYIKMRAAGTDASTNYNYQRIGFNGGTNLSGRTQAQTTGFAAGLVSTTRIATTLDLFWPAEAAATFGYLNSSFSGSDINLELSYFAVNHTTATAYDGFSLIPAAGTITGRVTVYGYQRS
jgi:hypothetical protein